MLSGVGLLIAGSRALKEGLERPPRDGLKGALPGGAGMKASLHGVVNLADRMRIIQQLIAEGRVDPEVRAWTADVLTRRCGNDWCVPEKDNRAEILAIFNAMRQRVRYTGDVWSHDTYVAARHTLRHRIADCDDYAILACSALGAVGIQTKCKVIQSVQGQDWDHIYVLANDGERHWIPFDASVNKPCGWEAPPELVRKQRLFDT